MGGKGGSRCEGGKGEGRGGGGDQFTWSQKVPDVPLLPLLPLLPCLSFCLSLSLSVSLFFSVGALGEGLGLRCNSSADKLRLCPSLAVLMVD